MYFPELGNEQLRAHLVPVDEDLRIPDAYPWFVQARRQLLAQAMTELIDSYLPSWIAEETVMGTDPLEGEVLVLQLHADAPDLGDAVVYVQARRDGSEWNGRLKLETLESVLNDLENGLQTEIELEGVRITFEEGADKVELPLGPFLAYGSLADWRTVLDRERAEVRPLSELPRRETAPFTGTPTAFPIVLSE